MWYNWVVNNRTHKGKVMSNFLETRDLMMRRLLRDMRLLAAVMFRRSKRIEANRILEILDILPSVRQPATIRRFRAEMLAMQEGVRLWPALHDDLSAVLTQLRGVEVGLEG